jgi:hypothetical protein
VVKFEDVRVNRGQGYNPSTGVFTSPRKGLYHISCLILGARGNAVQYQLNKNDAVYTYEYPYTIAGVFPVPCFEVQPKSLDIREKPIMICQNGEYLLIPVLGCGRTGVI